MPHHCRGQPTHLLTGHFYRDGRATRPSQDLRTVDYAKWSPSESRKDLRYVG